MDAPDSFSFMCTETSCHEVIGMLLSLSLYHPNAKVYGLVDTETKSLLEIWEVFFAPLTLQSS